METDRIRDNGPTADQARGWPTALGIAISDQLIGQPRRWRLLRNLASLALLVGVAMAIPRIDRWPDSRLLPVVLFFGISYAAIWAAHLERVLGRQLNRQVIAFTATVAARVIATSVFVVLSVALGRPAGESPIEGLLARLPAIELPTLPVIGIVLVVVFWGYRSDKRGEAALRAQAEAERSAAPAPSV